MRILVHDYAGHAFPVQLSRELARQGHEVLHVFAAFFQTPKGPLLRQEGDPAGFQVKGLDLGRPFEKYNFVKRVFQDRAYGKLLAQEVAAYKPQVVLGNTMSLDAQGTVLATCLRYKIGFVLWLQDFYGIAIDRFVRKKIPLLGGFVGNRYLTLERQLLKQSDHIIAITEDFVPALAGFGVDRGKITVIENWAPRDELPVRPRDNDWSRAHGLDGRLTFLYAGTLGLKHNPELLLRLAEHYRGRNDVRVVVVSEGLGADFLKERGAALPNLVLLPFQPFAKVPDMIASGDILIAILEPEAGIFSVPSKVLTYLCAGRPLLGAIPPENLAARLITRERAGIAVPPTDARAFVDAAERLAGDPALRQAAGKNALDYASKTFDIGAIGARFAEILVGAAKG